MRPDLGAARARLEATANGKHGTIAACIAEGTLRVLDAATRLLAEHEIDDPPCAPIIIHTYGLDDEQWNALFDRVAEAAHALDETVFCAGHDECATCDTDHEKGHTDE